MEWILVGLLGMQGYFTIFRLTPASTALKDRVSQTLKQFGPLNSSFTEVSDIIKALDQRLSVIETEIKLRINDSARIIEWLDKRDKLLVEFQEKIQKSLHIEEREKRLDHHQSEIIQLGKEIRLIREKK